MSERENPTETIEEANEYLWSEILYSMKREDALKELERQFDRVYLPRKISEAGENREQAAKNIGITPKTLRQKLRNCGLGNLVGWEEE